MAARSSPITVTVDPEWLNKELSRRLKVAVDNIIRDSISIEMERQVERAVVAQLNKFMAQAAKKAVKDALTKV